ncbi:MAG TPA: SdrD B-like domain-containing protein [Promineifilum sp.]|nr:SdrD B-like domain-containing protein [Promineifilum sp.]
MSTPTETATPAGTSTVCVNAFLDANGNGLHDADEGYLAGVTLTVAQGNAVIGQAVSTGTETPVCFGSLPAGTYQVGQTLPSSLEMTTQANATVNVGEGQTVGLEFGSRLRRTADQTATAGAQPAATETAASGAITPTAAPGGGTGGSSNLLVFLGIGAILIGVVLLGALLYTLLRR